MFTNNDLKFLKNQFLDKFYYGVVEDNEDPLKQGRYRVRVIGVDNPDPETLKTEDLPWARSLNTVGLISEIGLERTYRQGTYVVVVLLNEDRNTPLILGAIEGDKDPALEGVFSDPEGKYPLKDGDNYIKDYSLPDKTSFRLMNESGQLLLDNGLKIEVYKKEDERNQDGNFIRIEPNEAGIVLKQQDENVVKILGETIEITHKSGTKIEIDGDGNVNLKCKKYKIENDTAEVITTLCDWIQELLQAQMIDGLGALTNWMPQHITKFNEISQKLNSFKK